MTPPRQYETEGEFRSELRRFVESELLPSAEIWERENRFPRRVMNQCGANGFLTEDPRRNVILAEELPRCESLGVALSVFVQVNLVAPLIERYGTTAQKMAWLEPLLKGDCMGAMAVTEPDAGSDFASLHCVAVENDGQFIVNGIKTYITNGACADFLIVAARIGEGIGMDRMGLLLIPATAKGVSVERISMLGLNTSDPARIELRDCRISQNNLLGERGAGFAYVQEVLNRERLFGGIAGVTWAERAIEKTREFARTRRAFGRSISKFQAIRHQFAEMVTQLEAARHLNYSALAQWMRGEDATKEICMIKIFSYRIVQDIITQCVQIHGGMGCLDSHWTSRFYRDARALTIAAGTPEIMKDMVAACLRL